jgi:NADH:ubiquinone oxidoreductase subunit 5 (subunit L)/multisubunit Na+/H+ antiporter MnhA subunit
VDIIDFAWLIPVLPLISFLIVGLFGKKMHEGGGYVAIIFSLASMILSLLIAIPVLNGTYQGVYEQSVTWLVLSDEYKLDIGIYIDQLTALMLIVVSVISTLVVIYSIGYMDKEGERKPRYYAEISQLPVAVHFLGACRSLLVSTNRILEPQAVRGFGCQEGVPGDEDRRHHVHDRYHHPLHHIQDAELQRSL